MIISGYLRQVQVGHNSVPNRKACSGRENPIVRQRLALNIRNHNDNSYESYDR